MHLASPSRVLCMYSSITVFAQQHHYIQELGHFKLLKAQKVDILHSESKKKKKGGGGVCTRKLGMERNVAFLFVVVSFFDSSSFFASPGGDRGRGRTRDRSLT